MQPRSARLQLLRGSRKMGRILSSGPQALRRRRRCRGAASLPCPYFTAAACLPAPYSAAFQIWRRRPPGCRSACTRWSPTAQHSTACAARAAQSLQSRQLGAPRGQSGAELVAIRAQEQSELASHGASTSLLAHAMSRGPPLLPSKPSRHHPSHPSAYLPHALYCRHCVLGQPAVHKHVLQQGHSRLSRGAAGPAGHSCMRRSAASQRKPLEHSDICSLTESAARAGAGLASSWEGQARWGPNGRGHDACCP